MDILEVVELPNRFQVTLDNMTGDKRLLLDAYLSDHFKVFADLYGYRKHCQNTVS